VVYDKVDGLVGRGVVYEQVCVSSRMQFPHEKLSVYHKALGFLTAA
jgi:hypothetical protein